MNSYALGELRMRHNTVLSDQHPAPGLITRSPRPPMITRWPSALPAGSTSEIAEPDWSTGSARPPEGWGASAQSPAAVRGCGERSPTASGCGRGRERQMATISKGALRPGPRLPAASGIRSAVR